MTKYCAGVRAGIPIILGFVPVGLAYAIIARQAGFSVIETISMSLMVFAGASQVMAVGMYTQGAGLLAIVLATFILNLRYLIMSTCVVNEMKGAPLGLRLLAAFGVGDEVFALFTTERKENRSVRFFLGLITVTYSSWAVGTAIGAVTLELLPPIVTASLGIALYALFIGILVPGLTHNFRLGLLVVFSALCNLLLTRFMAPSWAMILSALAGAGAGVFFVDDGEARK